MASITVCKKAPDCRIVSSISLRWAMSVMAVLQRAFFFILAWILVYSDNYFSGLTTIRIPG